MKCNWAQQLQFIQIALYGQCICCSMFAVARFKKKNGRSWETEELYSNQMTYSNLLFTIVDGTIMLGISRGLCELCLYSVVAIYISIFKETARLWTDHIKKSYTRDRVRIPVQINNNRWKFISFWEIIISLCTLKILIFPNTWDMCRARPSEKQSKEEIV